MLSDERLLEVAEFIREFTPEYSTNRANNYYYTWKNEGDSWVVYLLEHEYQQHGNEVNIQLVKIGPNAVMGTPELLDKKQLRVDDNGIDSYYEFMSFANDHELLARV